MQALKCDRCGSFYEDEVRFLGDCPTATVELNGCRQPDYDLCQKCTADFIEWISRAPERNDTETQKYMADGR